MEREKDLKRSVVEEKRKAPQHLLTRMMTISFWEKFWESCPLKERRVAKQFGDFGEAMRKQGERCRRIERCWPFCRRRAEPWPAGHYTP